MSVKVDHDGRTYLWASNQWLYADTYLSPPGIIQQELNRRFSHLIQPTPTKATKSTKSSQSKGIRETIDPLIVNFIQERYAETQSFVPHDEIAAYLLAHPEANTFLQEAHAQTDQKYSFEVYVSNQVAWMCTNIDTGGSEYSHLLEKTTLATGRNGYRPKQ